MLTVDKRAAQKPKNAALSSLRTAINVPNETLRELVYKRLRDDILSNRLLPGTELQEVVLADALGVSRGPIREALHRLGADGLVTIRPRRGAVVSPVSKDAFLDAYQVRESLETLAVRLATPMITGDEIGRLSRLIELMKDQNRRSDVGAFFESNQEFHTAFVDLSGNEMLGQLHRRLVSEMSRYRGWSLALRRTIRDSIQEHREILGAVAKRDVERAVALTSDHVRVPQLRLETMSDAEVVGLALGPHP